LPLGDVCRRHRHNVEIVRTIIVVAFPATGLGLILESVVPASGPMIDVGAVVFAFATGWFLR